METISSMLGPVGSGAGRILRWWRRPKITLTPNIDKAREEEYYLRLRVENEGGRTAQKCTGRLIEIRDSQGNPESLPQLNFCWERHNQANPPHPEDIPKKPFAIHLDIAKYSTEDPAVIRLRVDANNQQLSIGDYNSEFRLLALPAKTYYVLVSIYTEDGYATTRWYALNRTTTSYTITESKPPTTG
jgi:hypothetical protein